MLRSNEILRFCSDPYNSRRKMIEKNARSRVWKWVFSDYLISPMDINELMARCANSNQAQEISRMSLKRIYLSSITQSITDGLNWPE
jgi:DNA-binding response OmpR family regulator